MVVVIGAGATGLGVAWDLILRGVNVTVVEKSVVGFGTSGRFHGLLHSGGRYAVSDPAAAQECIEENAILRAIAPAAIEDTGGVFVRLRDDDPHYEQAWLQGCEAAHIPVRSVPARTLLAPGSALSDRIAQVYAVPDGVLEGFRLMELLVSGIRERGGTLLTHHQVREVVTQGGRISGVKVKGPQGVRLLPCDAVVNAAGPWAGDVSALFGDPLPMHLSYGLMLLFAHRKFSHVVNRLKMPGDGDIFVPHQRVTILGTTDVAQTLPKAPAVDYSEVRRLMDLGRELVPGLDAWRSVRAFTGVRPLYEEDAPGGSPRDVSRDFQVIDHSARHGPAGAFSIVGGKWTTYRLMAERTSDIVAAYLNLSVPSVTASTPLGSRQTQRSRPTETVLCECEGVSASGLQAVEGSIDEWRSHTWFAMGPCQGTFCAHRIAAVRHDCYPHEDPDAMLAALRAERSRGMAPVLWGANAREYALQRAVRFQTLGEMPGEGGERSCG